MRIINETEEVAHCNMCAAEIAYFKYEEERDALPPGFEKIYRYFIRCPRCKKKIVLRKEYINYAY